eukprot:18248-Heterococcus_DN1.PRE.2
MEDRNEEDNLRWREKVYGFAEDDKFDFQMKFQNVNNLRFNEVASVLNRGRGCILQILLASTANTRTIAARACSMCGTSAPCQYCTTAVLAAVHKLPLRCIAQLAAIAITTVLQLQC